MTNLNRLLAKEKVARAHNPGNKRVKPVIEEDWKKARVDKFGDAISYAAVVKANRTACYLTQEEVGAAMGVTGQRFGQMESGHYFGWNDLKLQRVLKLIFQLSRGKG